ncbi:MAG: sialate O-acetylesterase [Kiritimatiellia bacterium]|jgi:hypothetical protein|nr:sialate O-acetylesterase [Kiritimatiellia bacterium]
MRRPVIQHFILSICLATAVFAADEVSFTKLPKDMQLFPRDLKTNKAQIEISGTVNARGFSSILLKVTREGDQEKTSTSLLRYGADGAPFQFKGSITAELRSTTLEVALKKGNELKVVATAKDLVAGDVFLINGQSNAEARKFRDSANANKGPFVRSFGSRVHSPSVVNDLNWCQADGDLNQGPGAVGQWGLRMGAQLVEANKIPVAIINGALGGRPIGHYKRNDTKKDDLNTNYGRLLYRCREAGVVDNIRAILWYQGESDNGNGVAHETGFVQLYKNWKEDYPGVEEFYVQQLRCGCGVGKWSVDLRDRQRRLPDTYPDFAVMSTTGIDAHDGCHYAFEGGYKVIGDRTARLVNRDLYGSKETSNVEAPNIAKAYFSNPERTEVTLEMRNKKDKITWDEGAHADFRLEGSQAKVTGGFSTGNKVGLTLSADGQGATGVTYSGHAKGGPWVKNEAGIGLLTFWNVPIKK